MSAQSLETRAHDFLAQKRIAIAGVSRDGARHPVGNAIYRRLKGQGRTVFAVNPDLDSFEGDPCYASLAAIPGGVDGVVIVTRPQVTEKIVEDAIAAGVPRVWMHGSSAKTTSVSPAAIAACQAAGVSVIAGACPMMFGDDVDFGHKCMLWMLKLSGGKGDRP